MGGGLEEVMRMDTLKSINFQYQRTHKKTVGPILTVSNLKLKG